MISWTSKLLMPRPVRLAFCAQRPACSTILNVIIAVVALLIFGATFRAGIDRGMDQMVTWEGYGRILNAISAVMTEQRFRQGGYALSDCIHNELERRGLTSDHEITKRIGVSFPQNLRAPFLDKVLEDMEHDLSKLPDQCAQAIRGLGADDVGYVDFAKLAFYLFGAHIRAFYYLFFLIYGLTLFVALIERHRDPMGQIILLSAAGLVYVSCYYSNFLLLAEPSGSGNMVNPRFMPVLALIPGIHLLLILVDKAAPNWWRVAIVLFQSSVIFFAIHIRASAIWWIPVLLLAAVVLFLLTLKGGKGRPEGWRAKAYRGLVAQWPALVSIVVILGSLQLVVWSLHPIYREGGWLSYHAVWHSIYYSLQFHPNYVEKYSAYHEGKEEDEMPIAGALAYLKEHPEEDKPELFITGRSLKYSAMERLVRLAFFEFLRRDPWFVFETFVIVKPKFIWDTFVDTTVTEWKHARWRACLLFFAAIALIGGMAARQPVEMERLSRLAAVVTLGAVTSLFIPLLTLVYAQVMTEEIMAMQMAGVLLLGLAAAHLMRAAARYRLWTLDPRYRLRALNQRWARGGAE
jgi:hypothetical protein